MEPRNQKAEASKGMNGMNGMSTACQNQERSIGNWASFSCSWKLNLFFPAVEVVPNGAPKGLVTILHYSQGETVRTSVFEPIFFGFR